MATIFESAAFRKEPTRRSEPADHTVWSEDESFLLDADAEAVKFHRLPLPVARVFGARMLLADGDDGTAGKVDLILTNDPLCADTAGTTTYTLISQSTIIQAGGQANTDAAGANFGDWYGKPLRGTPAAPWYLAVRVETAPGTPKTTAFSVRAGLTYQNDVKD